MTVSWRKQCSVSCEHNYRITVDATLMPAGVLSLEFLDLFSRSSRQRLANYGLLGEIPIIDSSTRPKYRPNQASSSVQPVPDTKPGHTDNRLFFVFSPTHQVKYLLTTTCHCLLYRHKVISLKRNSIQDIKISPKKIARSDKNLLKTFTQSRVSDWKSLSFSNRKLA